MKKSAKKYISILLSFFMLFQMLPVSGLATGEKTSNERGLVTNYKVTASVDTDVSSIVNYSETNDYNYYIVAFNGPTAYAVSTFNDVDFLDGGTQKSLNNINPLSFKVYKSLTNTKTVKGVTGSGIKTVLESSGYIGDIYFDWNATPNISGSTGTFEFHASRRKETVNVSFDTDPTSKGYWFLYASYSMDGVTYYRLSDPLSFTNNSATVTFEQLGTNGEKGTEGLANIPANANISFKLLNFKEQNNIIANKVIQEAVTQIGTSETYAAGYKFTFDNSTKTFNATQSNYQVEVNYSDSQNPSGNWCIYACYNEGTKAYYGYFTPSFSSGTATIDINSGSNRLSDQGDGNNGNYHYITPTDSIEVKLLHNPNNGNFKNSDGTISSEVNQITEGEKLKGYTYNYVTTGTLKTIITATKDTPYAYEVEVHDVDGSTITSGLTGTFNVVGWISRSTDGNNTTKYYQEKPIDLSNISTTTKKLTGLFDGNYVSYGTATYYETGDTVETAIGTVSGNYDESNLYADGEILQIGSSLYQVHETKTTGKSSIILKKLPDLKIKTVIGGTESGTLPTGYKLLISMTDGTGLTSYALTDLSTTAVSVPNFKANKNGSYSEIHYYTGSENLMVELVKTSSSELSAVIGNSVCYNEGDMLPELYTFSTALNSETYLATTTLAPVSNNGVSHTINVSFYEKKEGTAYTAIPDDAKLNATDNYFFRIRLYRDKKVAAYAIVEAKITDGETQTGFAEFVNNHGAFSLEISKDQQFIQVDAQGNDISGAPTVHYDPATFDDIDVRFYKTINNASVPNTLNFQNAVDAIDGFDFWDNNTTLTEDKSAANTAIRLYSAYKKIYQVKVIVEDGTAINDSDKLYLNVLADHDTTDDQALTDYSLTGITPDNEDGAKVYTIVIENQTEQSDQSIWTTGSSNSISGNEDFTLYLKQDTTNIANGCPVSLSEQSSNNYIAVYDTGKVENKNISYNSNDKVTTITHYVYIRPKTYEQAINPYSVLGAGAEYGVIAAHYIQNNHTETNFATHLYENPSAYPNEVDANGSLPIPFLIEAVGRGNLFLGASTKNNIDLYYSSDINKTDKLKKDGNFSSEYTVNYISKDKDSVKTDVDNLIRKLQQSSSLYAGRSFYTPTGNNIDTTMFPDNVTIYIDGSNIDFSRAQYITKLEKQTLVFNIPGEDVVLNKSYTTVKRKDGDTLITLVNELNSNTSGNGGDADHNRNVEDHVLNHIVFNMYQATHVQLESGPAGLFLVPKSNAVIDKSGGSPTGWMATGGKFEQNDGEWHFFRTQRRYSGNSTTQGANKMMIIDGSEVVPSGTEQVFTFVRESLNFTEGIWEDRVEMSNTGSNISFPEINFNEPTDEGDHYYLIYEVQGDESDTDYTYDQTRYVVKSTVTLTGDDLLTCSVSNEYYKLDNNAKLSEITESYEATVHEIINGVPTTNTTKVTRYGINNNLLTATDNNTESDVKFVNEKKNEQTGSLKITKAVRKNGSTDDTLSGEYTFTVNGPSSAAAENRVTKYVRINVTGGQPAQYKVADTETELATTSYTDGTTALISGLAAGEYTVVELSAGAMTLSSIVRGDSEAGNTATRSITLVVSAGVNDPANNSAAFVTFTNNKETTQISGTKTWVDQRQHNNNASEITLTLKRTTKPVSETSVWDTVTVSSTTPERLTWTGNNYVFSNLDKYNANGIEYEYKVEESAVNVVDGSTAVPYKMETTATSSAENGYHFINTELTTVTARKTWNGSDSSWLSGMTVTFRLKQNGNAITTNALGQTISTQTVSNKDETASWANLPKYYINENTVTAYTYTVEETEVKYNNAAISNYRNVFTVTGENNVTGTVVIDNTMKTTSRNVIKTWIDGQDTTKRPDSITYTLSAVDSDNAPVTLSQYGVTGTLVGQKTNNYAVTWNDLPEYTYTGKAVTYSISEGTVPNYMQIGTATYTESTKTWNFQNKELGKVRVTKEVSGGVSLPANFQITAQYNDKNGTAQTKVLKITGGDINATGSGTASSPYVWEIGDLLLGTVVTFAEENNRVYGYDVSTTVTDAAGTRTAMTGTATVVNGSVSNVAFVNTYTEKKTNVSVQKVWSDGNSNHNSDSITINLLRNGTVVTGQSITLPRTENENKIWTYTWTDLDAEDSTGNEITYSVAEVTTNGQITAQNGFSYTPGQVAGGKDATTGNYSYTITNAKGGETTVSVRKAWFTTNSGTTEVAWPSGVTVEVTLYRNNTPYDTVKELTSGATVTWTGLPEKDGSGNTYNYTVAETKVKVKQSGSDTAIELPNFKDLFGGSVTGTNNAYTVNNTIKTRDITVTKTWKPSWPDDVSEVRVVLKANGSKANVSDAEATLTDADASKTWSGLPVYDETGKEIVYSVEETSVKMNDVIYDSKSAVKLDELFKITANPVTVDSTGKVTLENEIRTTSLKVNKVWVFAEDSNIAQVDGTDGKWPKDGVVYVALYRTIDNVETEVDHIELTSFHTSHEFTNLPVHVGGKLATYTVKEMGISKNIDSSKIAVSVDKNTNGDGYTITNREKQAGLTITKHVSGKNLTDAEKAGIVFTVKGEGLPANGVTKTLKDMGAGMTWTLTSKDGITSGKTYTVTESGAAIENYTKVTKTKANDGAEQTCADNENINATANVTVDASTGMGEVEIWNTYTQDVGAVSVTKVFTGTPVLPEGFRITNDYNNTIFIPENADSGDGLKTPFVWKIEDVPVGTVITFTESNTAIDGYTLSAATVTEKTCAAVTKGTTVTVAFTNDYTEDISYGAVEVTKAFTGTPVLPEGFRITNDYNNTIFTPETAEFGDGLKTPFVWKIKDVPVGTVITFTESNTKIEGYILSAATVTEKTSAAVVKNDTVKVAFTNDYTEEISHGAVSVTKAFTGTPVLPEGFRITNDYDNSIFTPETAESGDGLKTPFVWKIDNVPVGTVITFTESNTAVDGYTLSEATVTEKTSAAVVKNDTVTVVFTNDYSRDMGSLQILKNVTVNGKATDGTLADGVYSFTVNSVSLDPAVSRTAMVTITNGQVAGAGGDGVTMAEEDGKKYARMANLPTGDYTVAEALTEEQVKKGISLIRKSADEVTVIPDGTGEIPTVEFTNNIVTIKVQKMDILTDEELTGSHIQILDKDGNVVEEWDSDADAPHEVTGLKTGEEYTLRETVAPKGYDLTTDATFSVDENGKVTTTGYSATDGNGNTILLVKDAPLMTTVAVRKVWKDDNNRDGIRPLTLTVRLKANGEVIATRQLTEDNHWTLTEKGLRKYDVNGDEIAYTWEEIVPTGYTAESAKTTGMLTTLTNTHIAETTSVSVKKAWNDEGNKFRTRPESIRVQLFANGKAEGKAVILNEANGWAYSWNDLLKYENTSGRIGGSKEIVYTVTEVSVPAGYTMSISGNAAKGFVITNSTDTGRGKMVIRKTFKIEEKEIEPELEDYTDIPVFKVWEDNNNRDGNRPESVTVILMRGGEEIDRATLTADSGWVHVFTHLPKYENNLTIRYSITEIPVEHYVSSIDGYMITNKYMPTLTTASVRKVWDDHNNRDGMRPASIRMLLSNGMSVTLDESNGWSATITDLPAIVNGKPAEYTWTEEKTAGYTQVSKEKNGNVTTFTNRAIETPNPGKAKTGGNRWAIFEEYDTALGGQLLINHVGDCFD